MKNKKKTNLGWGLFFIAAAAFVILKQLGYLGSLNLFNLIISICLIPLIMKSIKHLNFAGILFPLAFLAIMYDKQLGITSLTPWSILIVAMLLTIGLSIIFKDGRNKMKCFDDFDEVINNEDAESINLIVNFGSSIKYVDSNNFRLANLKCSFGAMKVYFDNAIPSKDGVVINIDISFGGAELYIPKNWQVQDNTNALLGGVEEKNRSSNTQTVKVVLNGNVSFSGVEIIYI